MFVITYRLYTISPFCRFLSSENYAIVSVLGGFAEVFAIFKQYYTFASVSVAAVWITNPTNMLDRLKSDKNLRGSRVIHIARLCTALLRQRDGRRGRRTRQRFISARCYASAVLAMGMCLSVCHKSEFC